MSAVTAVAAPPVLPAPAPDDPWTQVASTLVEQGVRVVFGLPDDDMRALRALEDHGVTVEWCRSQRTAVHMAAGSALATGRPAVVLVGRGPAVAAAVPGLLEADHGHAPVVVLAAGTATERLQDRAFQDAPTLALVAPVTRWAARVPTPRHAASMLREALARAVAAPAGPVYLEVPDAAPSPVDAGPDGRSVPVGLDGALDLLTAARRPCLLLGSGARSLSRPQVLDLAARTDAAVLVTASGRGCVPESHPRFLGVAGLYMAGPVRDLVASSDLVVAVGSQLEETALTGMPTESAWLQVTATPAGVHHRLPGAHLVRDAADWADALVARGPVLERTAWAARVAGVRARLLESRGDEGTLGALVVHALSDLLPEDAVVVHENGLHDMWSYAFPHLTLPDRARSIAPSEQTTLGFGVAAAAGAAVTEQPLVVCVTGDAALATLRPDADEILASRRRLLYVVLDDGAMGWLARQAEGAGSPQRFERAGGLLGPADRGDVLVVERPAQVRPRLAQAVAAAQAGVPTVVRVVVARDDVAPMLREGVGDRA
ncbi:thiamine pyrophosphate-binding protein [Phycicoccus flavus]|uniref:Thiamine pyrophosphate-binding protein n=1 Tax=Phycicoccus flavus TaxID=2502783 RepID=A0A8T6QZB1_9MICO|nr:thiamine pyrophosphate-binding protein [Phycicoccus flavus]NHA66997.1 thiamine pyrophosphate-binding protein [Phycicoccus flavus]